MTTVPKTHPLTRLLRYAKRYKSNIQKATFCSLLNRLFDLAPPLLIGAAVDIVVKKEQSLLAQLGFTDIMTQLWILTGLTVFIWAMESVFEYAYAWYWRNLAQTIQHDLRLDAYDQLQALDLSYFESRQTGGMMSILNDDINQLERFLDGGANDILQVSTTVVVISGIFFTFSPSLAIMAILPMPFVLWGSMYFQKTIAPRYADVRERVSVLNSQLSNNLSGIETIKSYTSEAYEHERIRQQSEDYRQSNRHAIAVSSAFSPLIRMVIILGFIATMVYGGWLTVTNQLSVGAYSVLVFLTQRLLWPRTRLGATFDLYQRAMASTTRVLDLLDTEIAAPDGDQPLPKQQVEGDIQFKDVTFSYPEHPPLMEGFSLSIAPGKTLAVVGSTGSGKSTLLRLLTRLYEIDEGSITVDGKDIREIELQDLRGAIGLVSQQTYLFHGSVKDNITYGSFDATDEEIIEAAKLAEAHEFIESLPQGYDTIIGERGQKLSGGQRQRLSIARAILKNPPILLLDEATSAVDNETEAAIQRSLEHVTKDRTTMIVAHRLSTIRHADEIIVLEYGALKERGTHEELLSQKGIYHRLWNVQTGESIHE